MTRRAQQKQETHDRIVQAAARRLALNGIKGASVDAVMSDAGLTHGGFYAHFRNKKQMVEEALASAQDHMISQLGRGLESGGREALSQMLARYLGKPHRDRPAEGCLIPVLMCEAPHAGAEFRESFEGQIDRLANIFAAELEGRPEADDIGLGLVALAVGGLALSRAVADEAYSDRILRAARLMGHAAKRSDKAAGQPAAAQ